MPKGKRKEGKGKRGGGKEGREVKKGFLFREGFQRKKEK